MRITELNISEFGGLKNLRISPNEKMNIIYGENESGKSTVMLFIKFMLYGLGRRSAANSDRERSVSWDTHAAAGSMTLEHCGMEYRIERRFTDGTRGGNEKLSIIRLEDGEQISTDKAPGEYFLGVPKEVFESSACVGQMRSADINGEKTVSSIQNMLTSADESVDTAKILKMLDGIRVGYRHKKGLGGSLYDAEQKINQQKQRLERARDATLSLEGWTQKLDTSKRDYAIVKSELEAKDALLAQINKINIIKRFEALRSAKEERRGLSERKKELMSTSLYTDFFPDNRHIAELKICADNLLEAEKQWSAKAEAADREQTYTYSPELAALGEDIERKGGPDIIIRTVEEKKAKGSKQNGLIATVWIIQVMAAVGGASLLLAGLPWGAALFGWTAVAIGLTAKGASVKRRCKAEIAETEKAYGAERGKLAERLALCMKELSDMRSHNSLTAKLLAELDASERTLDLCREKVRSLLNRTLREAEPTYKNACEESQRLERLCTEHERIIAQIATVSGFIEREEAALADYDEDAISKEISVDPAEATPTAIAEAEKIRSFLASKKKALEQRVESLNNTVIQLKANAEDPLPIADDLAELEAEYRKDTEFYDALSLAMDSISEAGRVMQGSITPIISARAGEILSRVTEDRYDTLRTTAALSVSIDSDGFSVRSDFLSGGTRDLAYLALRISLFMRIYGENMPPLILDESLCQLDDKRARRMLSLISDLGGEGIQSILFTSHKREGELCGEMGIEYNSISL